MTIKKIALSVLFLSLPCAVRASFVPGPVQVLNAAGTVANVGYSVNAGSVPVNVVNTPAVSQSGNWTSTGTVTNVPGTNLNVSVANTPSVSQSGAWSSTGTVTNVPGTTLAISGTVGATQSGVWSSTAAVVNAAGQNLNVSVVQGTAAVVNAAGQFLAIQGPVASGSSDAQNPVKTGGKATITAPPTKVSDSQEVNAYYGADGASIVNLDCSRELLVKSTITITTDITERVFISSGAASIYQDLVELDAINTSATAVRLDFRSAGGPLQVQNTIDFSLYIPAGDQRGKTMPHRWPQTNTASAWTVQASASVTDIRIYGLFCKSK